MQRVTVSWKRMPPGLNETLRSLREKTVFGEIPFCSTTWKSSASGKKTNGWTHWEYMEPAKYAAADRLRNPAEWAFPRHSNIVPMVPGEPKK